MGVQGLWDLVSPAGQRVNLAALENKVVAVDASIWMYHFLKAMRDEKGDMVKGAHLLGFFRRICKLLYLKIRPVFVFDGAPPGLKMQTLRLRAQQRASEERQRRKTVEKLLRNQLQQHLLKAAAAAAGGTAASPEEGLANLPDIPDGQEPMVEGANVDDQDAESGSDVGSAASQHSVQEAEPINQPPAGSRRWERMRRRYGRVPQAFRGFMAQRRGVSEVTVPELPAEPLRDILQVPDRRRVRGRMREPDEWKGYALPGGGVVTVPLDGPVALEDFERLDSKTKYMLLQRAQEAWFGESRLKAVEAKEDMGTFVNVQLEMFLRHVRTNKELEKVKRAMAEEVTVSAGDSLAAGEAYRPPSFIAAQGQAVNEEPSSREEAASSADPASSAGHGRNPRGRGRGGRSRGPRQLEGKDPRRLEPVVNLVEGSRADADLLSILGGAEAATAELESMAEGTAPSASARGEDQEDLFADDPEDATDMFGASFFEEDGHDRQRLIDIQQHRQDESAVLNSGVHLGKPMDANLLKQDGSASDMSIGGVETGSITADEFIASESPRLSAEEADDRSPHSHFHSRVEKRSPESESPSVIPHFIERSNAKRGSACIEEEVSAKMRRLAAPPSQVECRMRTQPSASAARMVEGDKEELENEMRTQPMAEQDQEDLKDEEDKDNREHGPHSAAAADNEELLQIGTVHRLEADQAERLEKCEASMIEADVLAETDMADTEIRASGENTSVEPRRTNLGDPSSARNTALSQQHCVGSTPSVMREPEVSASAALAEKLAPAAKKDHSTSRKAVPEMLHADSEVPYELEARNATSSSSKPEATRPAAASGTLPARKPSSTAIDGSAWCTTHFQYRWRCRQDGVDGECEAAGSSSSAPGPGSSGKDSKGKSRGSSNRGNGIAEQDTVLGDEEMEDLEFQRLAAELEDEQADLRADMRRAKRGADTVTTEMQADIERLLDSFGIPYVHAPAEAEAQCAFLVEARLVDAVASDDSDVLVFGAREVYRRLFSEDSMLECYTAPRLETRLGLVQEHLVALAMLLGCDYTLGVHGVGIVNGLEIIRAFAPRRERENQASGDDWLQSLRHLRSWAQNVANWSEGSAGVEETDAKSVADFKRSHTNFRTHWSFPEDFPSANVMEAFRKPQVDYSTEPFGWAAVDSRSIVAQLLQAADLAEDKVLERLQPALRRYEDTLRQPRITEYMVPTGDGEIALVRSSRMREALRGLRGEASVSPERPQKSAGKKPRRQGRGRLASAEQKAKPKPAAKTWASLRPGAAQSRIDLESSDSDHRT
eukprot:TRINITY_DN29077_c0_g1_i1.p1 TRINITY_DN29077_c0_g1~~TRINITY_DN29077_c0_g1_i1.p1  ORF type:complete len:1290 (-),score=288.18 TRINITY_DN29077_c0_g1_i1:104-3973(-)